jgi:integrase
LTPPTKLKIGNALIGYKKAHHTSPSDAVAHQLNEHPDTPQGRRDTLLMCLLLDHGLRVGEVLLLQVADFDLKTPMLKFYRLKVDKAQTHKRTADILRALYAWIDSGDCAPMGLVLRASRKGGRLTSAGIPDLSPDGCRHYWATYWAKRAEQLPKGLFTLQQSGDWRSLAMLRRCVEERAVANEDMA